MSVGVVIVCVRVCCECVAYVHSYAWGAAKRTASVISKSEVLITPETCCPPQPFPLTFMHSVPVECRQISRQNPLRMTRGLSGG